MTPQQVNKLVEKAKSDPKFLHELIFNPKNAVDQIESLDARVRDALVNINPAAVIGIAIGAYTACGPSETCSCTSGTCGGVTCGGSTCDLTCSGDSCGNTCGNSCGHTTDFIDNFQPDIADWSFPSIRQFR